MLVFELNRSEILVNFMFGQWARTVEQMDEENEKPSNSLYELANQFRAESLFLLGYASDLSGSVFVIMTLVSGTWLLLAGTIDAICHNCNHRPTNWSAFLFVCWQLLVSVECIWFVDHCWLLQFIIVGSVYNIIGALNNSLNGHRIKSTMSYLLMFILSSHTHFALNGVQCFFVLIFVTFGHTLSMYREGNECAIYIICHEWASFT